MIARILLFVLLVPACWAETPDETRALVRRSLARIEESDKKIGDYGFIRRTERKELTSSGEIKTQRNWTVKRELQDGFMVNRLLERDGKPLAEEERRKNEETIQKRLAELKAMTPEQLQKMRDERRKKGNDEEAWLKEFPEALDYKPAGEEMIDGRPALLLECSPRQGYQPKNMRAHIFEKMRGRLWIDKADSELVKADVEMFDTVNLGWGVLGRIEKGTRFFLKRKKVAEDTWFPEAETYKFGARLMLVKSIRNEVHTQYSDFRHRSEMASSASAR
jgi:hypothetical protein